MSGGSYQYAYSKIAELADEIIPEGHCGAAPKSVRMAFKKHLKDVAAACRAIEWNDSGDGDDREFQLIEKVLSPSEAVSVSFDELKKSVADITAAIKFAERSMSSKNNSSNPKK